MPTISIEKSIYIDFAHHIAGHLGDCINIHGHTWRFTVSLQGPLDEMGFVADFSAVRKHILQPVHDLLDHSLVLWEHTYRIAESALEKVGQELILTRSGKWKNPYTWTNHLPNTHQHRPGGIKVVGFDFCPTSERLAEWFWNFADHRSVSHDDFPKGVGVQWVEVAEKVLPTESVARVES